LYPKFKEKGFEVFSVSLDDDRNNWMKAIKKDKISWLQVNDNGGWEAKTAVSWYISALPTTFLIDRDGTLLAMDLEGKDLEKALKDILGD
jgi:peroxiredoxin